MPVTWWPARAAVSAKPPQPQPISRTPRRRRKREFAEHPLVLRLLRGREREVEAAFEQRRRVRHRRVEPQAIEVVAEVVVGDDVAARLPARVRVQVVLEAQQRARPPAAVERALERRLVGRQHRQQLREVRRIPASVHVAFGEGDVAAFQRLAGDIPVAQGQHRRHGLDVRRRRAAGAERVPRAIGRDEVHAADVETAQQREQQARGGRRAGARREEGGVE